MGLSIVLSIAAALLFIIAFLISLTFLLVFKGIYELYILAGGNIPAELQQRLEENQRRIEIFTNTPQTTHLTEVNDAVNINVQRLIENYGQPSTDDEFTREIKHFINSLKCINEQKGEYQLTESERKHAINCLERIKKNSLTHSINGLTLMQVLGLTWKACNDKTRASADSGIDINTRILQRKYQLVLQFIESQTTYNKGNKDNADLVCFTGTFNHIISSLYHFEEFSFLQTADKDNVREEFKNNLLNKAEKLLAENGQEDKKRIQTALSDPNVINYLEGVIKFSSSHPARKVLGDEECDILVAGYLGNVQYIP